MNTLLLFFLALGTAQATPARLRIAVIDTAVDLAHPSIAPFVDDAHLRRIPWDLTRSLAEFNHDVLPLAQARAFRRSSRNRLWKPTRETHGTLVARVMLDLLPPGRVELIPVPEAQDERASARAWSRTLWLLAQSEARAYRTFGTFLEERLERLTAILGDANVRVANVSLGQASAAELGLLGRVPAVRAYLRSLAQFYRELARRNPNVLFTLAAGNEAADLDQGLLDEFFDADLPNVLVVGATKHVQHQTLADYSNTSSAKVHVVTEGHLAGINPRTSGTSVAAPIIAHHVITQLLEDEGANAAQIKARALQYSFVPNAELADRVYKGHVLPHFLGSGSGDVPEFTLRPGEDQREDLAKFLCGPAARKVVRQYAPRSWVFSRGVLVRGEVMTALDYPALELKRRLTTFRCEMALVGIPLTDPSRAS